MSQTKNSVHPQIKKIIQNLDLDLSLELSRYEHSRIHHSALISQLSTNDDFYYDNISNSGLIHQSELMEKDKLEEEVIPVASHLVNEKTSILDRILTPWGIFGIIIFFAANLFIFLNLDDKRLSEVLNNNQESTQQVNPQTNQSIETNISEDNQNSTALQQPEKPTIPNTLPVIKETSNFNTPSPYPDLKTALLTEIEKQKSSSTKSPVEQKPTLPQATSTSNSFTTTPVTKQSKKDQENQIPIKYYVISNYKDINQFNRIKKIEPSAFITNIDQGMKIQLGVFENEEEANKKAQQLTNKGIENYLYNSI